MSGLVCRPVEATDHPGLTQLFEACDCRCHCRYWHFAGDKNEWLERCFANVEESRRELGQALSERSGEATGIIALRDGVVVGWLKIAPADLMQKAFEQRYYRGLARFTAEDRTRAMLVGCALLLPAERGRGALHEMLGRGIDFARERGAEVLFALPRRGTSLRSDEVWTGPDAAFERAGFEHFDGEDPYPVLAKRLVENFQR